MIGVGVEWHGASTYIRTFDKLPEELQVAHPLQLGPRPRAARGRHMEAHRQRPTPATSASGGSAGHRKGLLARRRKREDALPLQHRRRRRRLPPALPAARGQQDLLLPLQKRPERPLQLRPARFDVRLLRPPRVPRAHQRVHQRPHPPGGARGDGVAGLVARRAAAMGPGCCRRGEVKVDGAARADGEHPVHLLAHVPQQLLLLQLQLPERHVRRAHARVAAEEAHGLLHALHRLEVRGEGRRVCVLLPLLRLQRLLRVVLPLPLLPAAACARHSRGAGLLVVVGVGVVLVRMRGREALAQDGVGLGDGTEVVVDLLRN